LAAYAKDWVEIIARNDRLEKRSNNRHGENIFGMYLTEDQPLPDGRIPVDFWYSAAANYDYTCTQPPCSAGKSFLCYFLSKSNLPTASI
jgi:hypothetical protein